MFEYKEKEKEKEREKEKKEIKIKEIKDKQIARQADRQTDRYSRVETEVEEDEDIRNAIEGFVVWVVTKNLSGYDGHL